MCAPLRVLYMGTPEFAVAPLVTLIQNNYTIIAVVTAPDKPAGRGKKIQESAVKKIAASHNLPVLQPTNLRDEAFVQTVRDLAPDLIFVVAFRMLPKCIWEIPPLGTCNLHASLLPQYRGAAPINWALVHGETETGVTTFFINEEIDTGHIIAQKKVAIEYTDTAGDLHDKLMHVGASLVLETVKNIQCGNSTPIPQIVPPSMVLRAAPKISKEICKINWNATAETIYNHIRGFSPYPAAWFEFSNNKETYICKILSAEFQVHHEKTIPAKIHQTKTTLSISCADGFIFPKDIQIQGKKCMNVEECLRGFSFEACTII